MARDFATGFYHSLSWRRCREYYMQLVVETDHGPCPPGMCERCFTLGRLTPANTVHHKVWLTPENICDPYVTLDVSNLMRVCMDCHARIHAGIDMVPRVTFDEDGRVVEQT